MSETTKSTSHSGLGQTIRELNQNRSDGWRVILYTNPAAAGRPYRAPFVEAVCKHDVGHHNGTHGCDGCCSQMPEDIEEVVSTG